jgi:hypothetical protein
VRSMRSTSMRVAAGTRALVRVAWPAVGAELMILAVGALLMAAVDTVMERYHIECFMVVLLWFRERINVFLEPRGDRNPYHGKAIRWAFSIGSFALCAFLTFFGHNFRQSYRKFSFTAQQHGHRRSLLIMARAMSSRSVEIESGPWRCTRPAVARDVIGREGVLVEHGFF